MRLLLYTHAFLWFVQRDKRLSSNVRTLIEDPANDIFLSIASNWEIAIKASLGKIAFNEPFATFLPNQLNFNTIATLPITIAHTIALSTLPNHHRDPFDRMIIAQAIVEQIPVLVSDPAFRSYPITTLW